MPKDNKNIDHGPWATAAAGWCRDERVRLSQAEVVTSPAIAATALATEVVVNLPASDISR